MDHIIHDPIDLSEIFGPVAEVWRLASHYRPIVRQEIMLIVQGLFGRGAVIFDTQCFFAKRVTNQANCLSVTPFYDLPLETNVTMSYFILSWRVFLYLFLIAKIRAILFTSRGK